MLTPQIALVNFKLGTSYLVIASGKPLNTSGYTTRPIEQSVDELLWLASKPSRRIID